MKKIIFFLGMFFIPLTGVCQWTQLGQIFESLNYNYETPASHPNGPGFAPYMGDQYGDAVALSADGSIMAVGAPVNSGSGHGYSDPYFGYVRVFRYTDGEWVQIGEELRTGDRDNPWPHNLSYFGFKVALSDDGNILAVSEPHWRSVEEDLAVRGGKVHIYENINDQWVQIGEPITEYNENYFGEDMSLSADGSIVAVGNPMLDGGKVKTYKNVSGEWVQFGSTLGVSWENTGQFDNPRFGDGITMSADGTIIVVGAGGGGSNNTSPAQARIFEYIADDWVLTGTISGIAGTNFAQSMSLSADGSRLVISASIASFLRGQIYTYDKVGSTWEQTVTITGTAPLGTFGTDVSLSADGNVLAVGSFPFLNQPTNPQVKLYHWNGTDWVQTGGFYYEPTWTNYSGQVSEGVDVVVALSADGSVLAVGDRTFSVPDANSPSPIAGTYNGAGRAYAYLDCSFVTISVKAEEGEPICEGQYTTVTAGIEQEIYALRGIVNWYADVNDTVPLYTGVSYETPVLTETTSYWIEGVTATGCPSERVEVTVVVNQKTHPVVGFSYSDTCTLGTSAYPVLDTDFVVGGIFTAASGLVFADDTTGEVDLGGSTPGTYTITYNIAENSCILEGTYSDTFTINNALAPAIEFSYGEICRADSFAAPLLSSGFISGGTFTSDSSDISIDPLTGEIDVTNSQLGTYTIIYEVAEDEDTCMDYGIYSVEINIGPCFIQKGISPNGDDLNDWFDLTGIGVKKLKIYNRYGREVYAQSNYVKEWGGQDNNGNELPDGTYYYAIQKNDGEQLTGWIYINRNY